MRQDHEHHDDHEDDRPGPHGAPLSDVRLRVRALESLLVDKGLVEPEDELLNAPIRDPDPLQEAIDSSGQETGASDHNTRIAHSSAPRVTSLKRPSPSGLMTSRPRAQGARLGMA